MKRCLILVIALTVNGLLFAQDYLQVMTFNIRNSNAHDSLDSWQYRKDIAASQILFHEAHLMPRFPKAGEVTFLQIIFR